MIRTIMHTCHLPHSLWHYALRHSALLLNITYFEITDNTPQKHLTGLSIDPQYLKIAGSTAYVHKQEHKQIEDRAVVGVYLGVAGDRHGYKVY